MERQDVSRAARTIRSLMRDKKYKEVVKLAKSLRLDRINNGLLILDIVEAYEKLGEKKEAKNTLLNYYDVHGITGRNMMQKLIELCIETRDISNAVGLCMEFENEWPESSISYLMRYQITTSAGGNLEERIHYLEKYKEAEFEERWGYELAKLYDKNNQPEKCAEVCHEIICFFGHGKYVEKAVQLKERVAGLTKDETDILEAVKRREEEARIKQEEEERLAMEEAERMKKEEELRAREESLQREERLKKENAERLQREEYERLQREERENFQEENAAYFQREEGETFADEEDVESIAIRKAREAEIEKIRQTEEAARLLKAKKEEERIAREQKLSQVFKTSDRYAEVEKNKAEGIYFQELFRDSASSEVQQKHNQSGGGIFSSFGRVASDIRKTLQPDEEYLEDAEGEIEYITVGRDSQAYVQDIEERMLTELDMLDNEQISELTQEQIKELYELKILHNVREHIKHLIIDMNVLYNTKTEKEELERFVERDPYQNPVVVAREKQEMMPEKDKIEESVESKPAEPKKGGAGEETEIESIKLEEEKTGKPEESESIEQEKDNVGEPEESKTVEPEKGEVEESEESEAVETEGENTEELEKSEAAEPEEENTEEPEESELVEAGEEKAEEPEKSESMEVEEEKAEELEESEPIEPEEEKAKKLEESEPTETEEEKVKELEESEPVEPEEERTEEVEKSELVEPEEEKAEEPEEGESAEPEKEKTEEKTESKSEGLEENAVAGKTETILDRIEDPEENLTVKEFSECITAYAGIKGYQVEDTAYMTIAVLAEEMQQQSTPLSLNNAKKMTDDAIVRIQKRNPLDKIMDRYSKKRAYLLKDRHFYWKSEKS